MITRPRAAGPARDVLPWFVGLSVLAHGVALGAMQLLPADSQAHYEESLVSFEVTVTEPAPAPSVPEPVEPVVPPPPVKMAKPRILPAKAPPTTAALAPESETKPEDSAPPLTIAESSAGGLAVGAVVGNSSALATVQGGIGTGTGPAPVARIDLTGLARSWSGQVGVAVNEQASRNYPRSALRAHIEGRVLLAILVAPSGKLVSVDLAQSSGYPQLDEAALASARMLGDLPIPPEALHRHLRPIKVPVTYRLQ